MNKQEPFWDRVVNKTWKIMMCLLIVGALHYGRRIFIADRFRIPVTGVSFRKIS